MSAQDKDPYTLVTRRLWQVFDAIPEFSSAVKRGNRISSLGDRDPIKDEVMDGDLPEARIVPVGNSPIAKATTTSVFDVKTFELQISSGSQALDERHYPLQWAVFRAMAKERRSLDQLKELTWRGQPFVIRCQPAAWREGVSEIDLNRGIKGWAGIYAVEVEMSFSVALI